MRYQPESRSVVNLGYRYQRDRQEQVDFSTAWPVTDAMAGLRTLASIRCGTTSPSSILPASSTAAAAGTCGRWRGTTSAGAPGERDRSFFLQLELKGLSSVGLAADAFLEKAIRGYSTSGQRR